MLDNSFLEGIEYKCHESYSCDTYGCYEEGICRCLNIDYVEIKKIDIQELSSIFFSENHQYGTNHSRDEKLVNLLFDYDPKLINRWCIERILTINKVFELQNWSYTIQNGYYGEEVEDFKLDETLFRKVCWQIEEILHIDSLKDRVFYLLDLEYGSVLDSLKDKNFYIDKLSINRITFPNSEHKNIVSSKNLDFYKSYNLPKAIVSKKNDSYNLVDGYHRLVANTSPNFWVIIAE